MATTTNFGWETPDDTDLVKDGALAMRTLGNSIDASFVDLKGGTTGQVLSKASNTDLDFTWVAQDDSNAIQNAIVDAKGDLISATAADTPARLAVGTDGQVLTADSTTATGLKWATAATPTSGLTFISRTALSGAASYNFTDVFTSTYKTYLILIDRVAATTSSHTLRMRMRYGSTTDDGAGQYYQGGYVNTYQSANSNLSVNNGTYWELNDQCGDGQFARNTIWIDGVGTGSNTRAIYSNNGKTGGNQANVVSSGSCGETARNYTGFHLYTSGGSNLSGNVTIYGLAAA